MFTNQQEEVLYNRKCAGKQKRIYGAWKASSWNAYVFLLPRKEGVSAISTGATVSPWQESSFCSG